MSHERPSRAITWYKNAGACKRTPGVHLAHTPAPSADATGADAIVAALECGVLAVLRFSARAQRLVVVQRLRLPTAPPPPGLGGRHLAASPCGSAVLACARLHALAVFWRPADAPEQVRPRASNLIDRSLLRQSSVTEGLCFAWMVWRCLPC